MRELGAKNSSLLEIGAGIRALAERMRGCWNEFDDRSRDITFGHDFTHSFITVGFYDIICVFEVIKQLTLQEAAEMLIKLRAHLKPGGLLILTTPNTFYPPAYLRDATHVTPFCFDELAGLVSLAGYQVQFIYRLFHDSLLKKCVKRFLMYSLFRVLGIDYAKQVLVVAKTPL